MMQPLLVTKSQAAEALGVSVRQIEVYVSRGEISARRLGRRCVRIEQAELKRFVKRLKGKGPVGGP